MKIQQTASIEFENRVELLQEMVSEYINENELRCYLKPVKVNGWPFGYARTFKIILTKPRRKRR